ncbi:anti-sigma factor [soil metagenome]
MTPRTHAELAELLGAYALDALGDIDDEHSDVERHLTGCARCRAEVEEHREVAALLAHEGAAAPDGLWDRISGSLESAPPDLDRRLYPVGGRRPATSRRRRVFEVTAAAAAIVAIAVLGFTLRDLDQRLNDTEDEVAAERQSPDAVVVELTPTQGSGPSVQAVIAPGGQGSLVADELPRLRPGRTYRLWGMGAEPPVSLGVLGRDPGSVDFTAGAGVQTLAISAEPEPGRPSPTGRPVVLGALQPA